MPVVEGYALLRGTRRSERGGDWLDERVAKWLADKKLMPFAPR